MVVGDPKQMPPTSFFAANTVDEDNLDTEDLLRMARYKIPSSELWAASLVQSGTLAASRQKISCRVRAVSS